MTSVDPQPAGSEQPASRPRLTLTEGDIEIVDVDAGRPSVMAASEPEVMTYEPIDYRDVLDNRPRPSDVRDANNDTDDHDGDAYKWP